MITLLYFISVICAAIAGLIGGALLMNDEPDDAPITSFEFNATRWGGAFFVACPLFFIGATALLWGF